MIHLGELETTDISGYNDCMVFAFVGIIDKLKDMLEKLSIGDDD